MFTVVASGYVEGDEPVPDPTTILGQLTEAADRANQAAQNADDSTIDKVDVTMLPTGSSASGSVSDKTLSLSIPNGPRGPQGPKGDPGDLTTVAHDNTLTGNGTSGNVLRQAEGSCLRNGKASSLNDLTKVGVYKVLADSTGVPVRNHRGTVFVSQLPESSVCGQLFFSTYDSETIRPRLFMRVTGYDTPSVSWTDWAEFAQKGDLSNYVPLSTYQALEAKVQALEAKVKVTQINATGTDLHTLFDKSGTYIKMWGASVVNAPNSIANGASSKYLVTVVIDGIDGYMRIDPMAGITDSYYCRKSGGTISSWYKITATEATA